MTANQTEHAEQQLRQELFDQITGEWLCDRRNVLLIHGGPGLGKTFLLDRLAVHATESGHTVLHATAEEEERGFTLGVIGQWFHAIPGTASEQKRTSRLLDATAAAAIRAMADGNHADPALLQQFQKLFLNLRGAALERPCTLLLDDAHHADAVSQLFLLHLVRRLPGAPMRLVIAENPDIPPTLCWPGSAPARQPHVRQHVMTPLSPSDTASYVAHHAPGSAPDLAATLRHLSGGNPALLVAAARDHRRHGAPHRDGYGRTVLDCLRRGEPLALRAMQAAVVLRGKPTPVELAWMIDSDPEAVQESLKRACATGLLTEGRMRHPAAAAAVLDNLTAQQGATLHQRAARLRYQQGAADDELAHHLLAGRRPYPRWAADVLVRSADKAAADGDVRPATERLRAAIEATDDDHSRAQIRSRLAQLEAVGSPAAAALHLGALVAAASLDQLDANHRAALVRQLLWHGRTAEARQILAPLRTGPQTPDLRAFENWLRWAHPSVAADPVPPVAADPEEHSWLQRAGALADRLMTGDVERARTQAAGILDDLDVRHGHVWAQEAALLAFATLNAADDSSVVAAHCDRLLREEVVQQAPAWQAIVASAQAEAALRSGDLAVAVDLAQTALTHLTRRSWGVAVGQPLGVLVLASTRAGEFEEAAQWLALPLSGPLSESRWAVGYLHARAQYRLATGEPEAAFEDFVACGRLGARWQLDKLTVEAWHLGAAEACLRSGKAEEARRLLALPLPPSHTVRARATMLRLQAELLPRARQAATLIQALELFEACGDRYEQARTFAELSRAHQSADERDRARTAHRRAWHLATTCEAAPLRKVLLADRLGDASLKWEAGTGPGAAELTDSERRVASLAALGYTNKEIADRLFITASTVEQHLTRVYRKLSVSNRRDLPSWLNTEMAASA